MENKKLKDYLPQAISLVKKFTNEENIRFCWISLGYEPEINQKVETIEELENWEKLTKVSFEKIPNPVTTEQFVAEKILENLLGFVKLHSKNGALIEFDKKFDKQVENIM